MIVESPAKARKIASYLGRNFVVESSRGHIRDLPRKAAEVPAKYKGESWSNLGVNVDNGFEPIYIVTPDKKSTVTELKEALKTVDELYLATDGDREGEAIAWHLLEALKPKVPVSRMVFHEITESAILAAAREHPRRSTRTWSTPRRPGASSTASTATRSARSCGRRSPAACPPGACSPSPPASWWTASGSG